MEDLQRQSTGAVIRTLREAQGLTRQQLVDLTAADPAERVSLEMLAKVEQGRKAPSAKTLRKLALAIGIETVDLSGRAAWWEAALAAGTNLASLRAGVMGVAPAVGVARATRALAGGLPVAGALGVGVAYGVKEARERQYYKQLLEARMSVLLEQGSTEQIETALQTLDAVLPPADGTP